MKFINTRPVQRAQDLNVELGRVGYEVIELPMLELQAIPYSNTLENQFQQLELVQVIVVVSPMAVEVGMQYLKYSDVHLNDLTHVQWIAVGQKTAEMLLNYGVSSIVPEVETSEGMLSLPIFDSIENLTQIAFWRGEGGRQFMMQSLIDLNINVINMLLYERYCPEGSQAKIEKILNEYLQQSFSYITLVSSEASWNNWLHLCQKCPEFLVSGHYLVLADRLYQTVLNFKLQTGLQFKVTKIENLTPQTILAQLKANNDQI